MMRMRWILSLAGLLLVASAIAGVAQPHFGRSATTQPAARTIAVTGNGSVTAVPDRATFGFTIDTRAKTASAALAQNSTDAAAVIAALKAAGVASADLQTSQVSLQPQSSQDGTQIIGYVASNSLTVKTALSSAGKIVDAAVGAGANGVSGPSLDVSDQSSLYREALRKAVDDAKLKAQSLADAAGLSLGAVQSIAEGSASSPVPIADKMSAAGAPVEAGTQQIQASVTVTYAAA
ncbi:MAG: uncharacterized protein QOI27_2147 [Gaiellaceae bacterium]|nr:uncharacterized protein [Gaiellaceae bacterium]